MSDRQPNETERESTDRNYNYMVFFGGSVYETRHEAVGAAAIKNRRSPIPMCGVAVVPDIIGAAEAMENFGDSLQPIAEAAAKRRFSFNVE